MAFFEQNIIEIVKSKKYIFDYSGSLSRRLKVRSTTVDSFLGKLFVLPGDDDLMVKAPSTFPSTISKVNLELGSSRSKASTRVTIEFLGWPSDIRDS
jgi:hypothetical protein